MLYNLFIFWVPVSVLGHNLAECHVFSKSVSVLNKWGFCSASFLTWRNSWFLRKLEVVLSHLQSLHSTFLFLFLTNLSKFLCKAMSCHHLTILWILLFLFKWYYFRMGYFQWLPIFFISCIYFCLYVSVFYLILMCIHTFLFSQLVSISLALMGTI